MIVAPALVALREGIEAALIIGIILSYLKRTGQTSSRTSVIWGFIAAIIASIAIASVFISIWSTLDGAILSLFEGLVVLVAAVLLTSMIVWMWNMGARITTEIEHSVETRIALGESASLGLLSFALVLREGVELVLFTFALAVQDVTQTIIGTVIGLLFAGLIGVGIYWGSLKINLKSLFKWTSVFLILVAAGMIAYGIHELQDAGLMLIGPMEIWNINPPLLADGSYPMLHENGLIGGLAKSIFGYNGNPSGFEVGAYFSYLLLIILYYTHHTRSELAAKQTNY